MVLYMLCVSLMLVCDVQQFRTRVSCCLLENNKIISWVSHCFIICLQFTVIWVDWLADYFVGWLAGSLADYFISWFVG